MINFLMLNQYRKILFQLTKDIYKHNHGYKLNENSRRGASQASDFYGKSTTTTVGTTALAQRYQQRCHSYNIISYPKKLRLSRSLRNRYFFTSSSKEEKQKNRQEEEQAATDQSNIATGSMLQQMKSLPNLITLSRIACTPYISYLILNDQYPYAAAGCILAGFTDWLDGYVAKRWELKTVLGTYLDPLADKVTVAVISCTLAYQGMLPSLVVFIWMGRDIGLLTATYYHVRSATKDDCRPVIDPARTPLKVEPTNLSKMNTVLQFFTMAMAIAQPIGGNYECFSGVDADLATDVFTSFWYVKFAG